MCAVVFVPDALRADAASKKVNGVKAVTDRELKNWQQTDSEWGSYVVSGGKNNMWCTGCGILATCNALHYTTGYFMDPAQLAEWANKNKAGFYGDYTRGNLFFARFNEAFGEEFGFSMKKFDDTEGPQNLNRVRQFVDDTNSKQLIIDRDIRNGSALIAYVENHFIAIVDYNSMTDKFLVWDNAAGDAYGEHRAGITHAAGDWFTWEELRGTLKNDKGSYKYFNVEYVVPLTRTEGKQIMNVSRDELTVGDKRLQKSGECCNFTPVNLKKCSGKKLEFTGSYTSVSSIEGFGYRIDGGETVYKDSFMLPASETALAEGVKWCGTDSVTESFHVSVSIGKKVKCYDVVVKEGGTEKVIWTAVASSDAGTPIPYEHSFDSEGSISKGLTIGIAAGAIAIIAAAAVISLSLRKKK